MTDTAIAKGPAMTARPMTLLRAAALAMLEELVDARNRSGRIADALREEGADLSGFYLTTGKTETAALALINAALGDGIAEYFLYECWHIPGHAIVSGREYRIATLDDVRRYLDAEVPDVPR